MLQSCLQFAHVILEYTEQRVKAWGQLEKPFYVGSEHLCFGRALSLQQVKIDRLKAEALVSEKTTGSCQSLLNNPDDAATFSVS